MARSKASGEDQLIARYFKPLATHPGAFGLIDDAAALTPPKGADLVLTTDAIVAGVHFFADDPAEAIAKKALRVNLSDLAAKGAAPLGCLLSLALPKTVGSKWLAGFSRGLAADTRAFKCPLFGGDTVSTHGPIAISIAMIGAVPRGKMIKRGGARAGDRVFLTGTIGDAALGLKLREDRKSATRWKLGTRERKHLAFRYLVPQPRNALASALLRYANGGMDVSDGLVGDLAKLCRASGVGAEIDAAAIPLSPAVRRALAAEPALLHAALTGGDDYEVLATLPTKAVAPFRAAAKQAGVAVTEIGRIVAGQGAPRFVLDGRPLKFRRGSYSHF